MYYTDPEMIRQVMRKLPTSITDGELELQINKAEALVDSKLGSVFVTPLMPVPPLIRHITTDIAVFFITENLYSSQQPNLDEYQKTRYERALAMIDEIILGDLSIGFEYKPRFAGYASTNDAEPIFTLEEPEW